ncbi:transglutaminaseTgpA domain-containing protein [Rhodoglobus sp. NPDC076762]
MTPHLSRSFVVVSAALLWASLFLAATALWPIYRTPALTILVTGAVLAGSLVVLVSVWRRWSLLGSSALALFVFLVIGVPLAVPSETEYGVVPSLDGLVDLVLGVGLGWKQLLTISLPVGDYQALLVPALVLVYFGTVVSLSVAFRTTLAELSVVPPLAIFVMAIALGPTYPDQPIALTLALLAVVGLSLVWFRWRRRRDTVNALEAANDGAGAARRKREFGFAGVRTVISAVVILALASGFALAAANAVPPTNNRSVLRTAIVEPFDPRDYVSPLSSFRRYWQPSTANSVLFEVSGVSLGTRIRLATLDSYTGVVYAVGSDRVSSESGSFSRVPSRFDQSAVDGEQVSMTITIADYAGVWLPTVGLFEAVDFDGAREADLRDSFYYNKISGTAAVVDGLTSGDAYTFEGVVPRQPAESEISTLSPGLADVPPILEAPDELTEKLDQYVRGAATPGERLEAMLVGLAEDGYVSHGVGVDEPASRSGHSADRIAELATAPRMIGDGEQYAVAASMMATQLGFPTRVVLGFVTSGAQIRGDDVAAWIEVNTAEFGWVTIDPNPPLRDIPDEDPDDVAQVARPQTVVQPPEIESDTTNRQSTPDGEQALQPDLDPVLQAILAVLRVAGWILAGLAVLAAPFVIIVAAKMRRRQLRKRAATHVAQISGGWQEFEDSLIDHGYAPPIAGTRTEVAAVMPTPDARHLAERADRAIFSGSEPESPEVDEFWTNVSELEAQMNTGLSRWARFKTKISLRSLGGYSVTSLFKR